MAKIISDQTIKEISRLNVDLEKESTFCDALILGRKYQVAFQNVLEMISKSENITISYE
jgi:hypothetical protein